MPIPIHLTVHNRHGSQSAVISATPDPQPPDGFAVAGLRNRRLLLVLPGAEERVIWNVNPIEVPHTRAVDHWRGEVGTPSAAGEPEGEGWWMCDPADVGRILVLLVP